jgi:hypothetical protein
MNQPLAGLPNARHRLARLRNQLHDQLANLKSGSTIYKQTKGRLGGVMDCIQILDEEMLAEEQGPAQLRGMRASDPVFDVDAEIARASTLRPDQVAWLNERRGE